MLALYALRQLPRVWKHETGFFDKRPPWWPWDDALWRAYARAIPLGVVAGWLLLIAFAVGSVIPKHPKDEFGLVVPLWYAVPLMAVVVVLLVLLLTVIWFKWPRTIIPPHLRDEPGGTERRANH